MSLSLADRLGQARHARFVGRNGELSLLESALSAETSPFFLMDKKDLRWINLYLFKTTLRDTAFHPR